jgi:OOP family OmpA-OmpF porin
MRAFVSAAAGAALLAAAAPSPVLASWYAGLTIGGANVIDAPDVVPVVGATTSSIVSDERDPGVKVLAGYRFHRNFALEGGYAWLGEYQFTNQVTAPVAGALNADVRVIGLFLDAVGLLPLGANFTALAKVGIAGTETRTFRSVSGNVTPAPTATTNQTSDDAGLKYGLGMQYDLGRTATVRAEWERFTGLGGAGSGDFDIDLYSVGLLFRF